MTQTVLILGATGRFGRAATKAFLRAGWDVTAASRKGAGTPRSGLRHVACDPMDRDAVIRAAQGMDVIVHAVNMLYREWAAMLPDLTANVIAAGLASGATVMIPGNVYVFDKDGPEVWHDDARGGVHTRKGMLRVEMEAAFERAADQGLRTIVLRGGDFIESGASGNWFDKYIAHNAYKGGFTYPGRMDAVHAWAYLPDMARAAEMLAAKRDTLPPYASFGFEGYSLTGEELKAAVSLVVGRPLKLGKIPWFVIRMMGVFSKELRELMEMRYLWDTPHRLDPAPLRAVLPDFTLTPLEVAMRDVVAQTAPVAARPQRARAT